MQQSKGKIFYFGMKKKYTVKTQFMVNNHGIIIHKTDHKKKGSRHDYDIYKENHPIVPKQVVNEFDFDGYLGIEKDFPEQLSSMPKRKKRNLEISKEEI